MSRLFGLLLLRLAASACSTRLDAQHVAEEISRDAPAPDVVTDLHFSSLRDLAKSGDVLLAGGEKIEDPELWAAVLIAKRAGGYCTASLIGPNVLLTAAHCVDARDASRPARTVGGTIKVGGIARSLQQCAMSRLYLLSNIPDTDNPRSSEDFAFCEVSGVIEDITFETLSENRPSVGAPLLLSGYGCTRIGVWMNRLTSQPGGQKLRAGNAIVDAVDVLDSSEDKGSYLRSRAEDFETILCPGDSGGPAFTGATLDDQAGPKRRVVGVNSKVVAVPDGGSYAFLSFFAATSATSFAELLREWQTLNPTTRRVCGRDIASGDEGCRE